MRYVCLVYSDESEVQKLPLADVEAFERSTALHDRALRQTGRCLASERLHPADMATTLRVRDRDVLVEDGPVVETPEPLTGLYLIVARDLNDAIRTASALPSARIGAIEVRPVCNREV